ncbi:hypothetical protein D3C71_365110 [compost metagenome]
MRSLWDRLFKNDLRRAQQELDYCKSFVRIAVHEPNVRCSAAEIYHVTEFNLKENTMHFFEPQREGNFSMKIPHRSQIQFLDAGACGMLGYDHDFNKKLERLYRELDANREELRGKRIYVGDCAQTNHPLYLTATGMYRKLSKEDAKHWPRQLPFEFIALMRQAPGISHYYQFGYYATRGTRLIYPNVSKDWEPDPHYRSLQEEREAKLIREYNDYLKADHFENGDLIQEGTDMPVVFIRYTDPERTGMVTYPDGEVKGIRRILRFKLIQRKYRQAMEEV